MSNSKNIAYQNSWNTADSEIMTLNESTKESKAEIQLSKHPFPETFQ